MAPTSDERREVAARLREAWPEAGGMEEVWEVLDPILGTHDGPDVYKAWEQTFNRLSDLIDPTCHVIPGKEVVAELKDGTRLTGVLLSCGHAVFGVSAKDMPRFCCECGARITNEGEG